jgi:uncharacterized protein (TIGR03067 family)
MKSALSLMAVVVLTLSAVGQAQEEKPPNDLKLIQGQWRAWLTEDVSMLFEVEGQAFTLVHVWGDQRAEPWRGLILIEQSAKPREITWVSIKSGEKDLPDNCCIYELHGDTLLLIGGGATKRPERFFSGGATQNQTLVFKREPKK